MSLPELVQQLAAARQDADLAANALRMEQEQFAEDHADLFNRVEGARKGVADIEGAIRETALAHYAVDGNKKPSPGVGIRVSTKLDYTPANALAWAKEHSIALSLDKRAFEKIAKVDTPEFVTVTEEPQATIARELTSR
jgi:hypothetical protein|tara:strand:+ start:816 stop:1232 length:417 start_codon:yes stop_codon:yes gene_type:complete